MPGLGRIEHWDPKNEQHELKTPLVRRVLSITSRSLRISQPRSWRQWMWFDQGEAPACTAYGSATFLAAAPIKPDQGWLRVLDIMAWYRDNVAEDRAHGRVFSEGGATTLAAMEVAKRRGYISKYEWALNFETILTWIHGVAPLLLGTNWYSSMFVRSAEGIVRITRNARNEGGHLWCAGAFDPRARENLTKRGLITYRSTWGDGNYLIPVEDVERLFNESGEAVFPSELKPV